MKRDERTLYNRLKKEVTPDTINVEIPVNYTHEGRQAIHELLTIEKKLYVTAIYWNDIMECYCIHYERAYTETAENIKREQEAADIDDITADMEYSDWTWTGYHKPTQDATAAPQTAATAAPTDSTTPAENAAENATQAAQTELDSIRAIRDNITTDPTPENIQTAIDAIREHAPDINPDELHSPREIRATLTDIINGMYWDMGPDITNTETQEKPTKSRYSARQTAPLTFAIWDNVKNAPAIETTAAGIEAYKPIFGL